MTLFCYQFDVSIVNSLTLSIPWVGYHLVFIVDFKFNRDSVFTGDLWIRNDMTFLTIPWVFHDCIFAIDLMYSSWIHWRCRFHTSAVTQYSLTISRSTVTLFSLTIYGSAVTWRFWQFHASAMTIFLLWIWCIVREFSVSIDSLRRVSLTIHWRFQGLRLLCFRRWFMDQLSHNVFDNSISLPWFYFCYRFDSSFVNSLTLLIPYVGCNSVFIDDFKFNRDSICADDLRISSDIALFDNSMR